SAHSLKSIGSNAAASWQQAGLLRGRATKVRQRAECRPLAVTYALVVGHLCGARGDGLFDTLWTQVLDAPAGELRAQAATASQHAGDGWRLVDLTDAFARWMADHEYRDADFEQPEDMALSLKEDFSAYLADRVGGALTASDVDETTVVAVLGLASLFGLTRAS